MSRPALTVSIFVLSASILPLTAGSKPANVPASADFAATGRVRSDGGGAYVDGCAGVQAWYALPKGNFFLRTVRTSPWSCHAGSTRGLVLDFSDRLWPGACTAPVVLTDRYGLALDACGVNAVPDVRVVADRLFSATATKLDLPFSLQADFQFTAFELSFVETLAVTGMGPTRTMTAAPGAVAELYQINGRSKTLVGRYQMPLEVTVSGL